MKTVGILLAGGASRRFGSPKMFAKHEGKEFYRYSWEALKPYCDTVAVVARPEFLHRFPNKLRKLTDIEPFEGQGPLAGILSAMESIEADRYIVLPCDMPFITPDVVGRLLGAHSQDITAVSVEGKRHPLVSVWQAGTAPSIRRALGEGSRRVMDVQAAHDVRWVEGRRLSDTPEKSFKNINTPCELEGS